MSIASWVAWTARWRRPLAVGWVFVVVACGVLAPRLMAATSPSFYPPPGAFLCVRARE